MFYTGEPWSPTILTNAL